MGLKWINVFSIGLFCFLFLQFTHIQYIIMVLILLACNMHLSARNIWNHLSTNLIFKMLQFLNLVCFFCHAFRPYDHYFLGKILQCKNIKITYSLSFRIAHSMVSSDCTTRFCQKMQKNENNITYFSGDQYQDNRLNATPIAHGTTPTIFHCLKNCSSEMSCFSMNYEETKHTCELLQENIYANVSLMVNSSGWTHVSVFVRCYLLQNLHSEQR